MAFEEVRGPAHVSRIEAVRGNAFVVDGRAIRGGFLIWPGGLIETGVSSALDLSQADFAPVLDLQPARDVLLIGTGASMVWPSFALLDELRTASLGPEVMDSRAAARTYNLLIAEERLVAALILPLG